MTDTEKKTGYKRRSQPYEGGDFLKWSDGETIELTITSEHPESFFTHFIKNQGYPCLGDECQWCEAGDKPTLRWKVSVLAAGEENTWNMSNQVCDQLESIAEMMGALQGLKLRVYRRGTGLQTRYTVVVDQALPVGLPDSATDKERTRYIKELCIRTGIDFDAELARFVKGAPEGFAELGQHDKLVAFHQYLEEMVATPTPEGDRLDDLEEIPF